MKYCSNCGRELADTSAFCSECGAPQQVSQAESQKSYQEPVYQAPVYQAPVYQPEPATLPTSAKILGLISMICGLLSLVSCYAGFAYSIPALILANIAFKKAPGVPNTKAKVGKITGIIGIVVSVICFIAYIVLMATGTAFVTEHMYDI